MDARRRVHLSVATLLLALGGWVAFAQESPEPSPEALWQEWIAPLERAEVALRQALGQKEGVLELTPLLEAVQQLADRVVAATERKAPLTPEQKERFQKRFHNLVQQWEELQGRLKEQAERTDSEELRRRMWDQTEAIGRELRRIAERIGGPPSAEEVAGALEEAARRLSELAKRLQEGPPEGWREGLRGSLRELSGHLERLMRGLGLQKEREPKREPGPHLEVFRLEHVNAEEAVGVLKGLLGDGLRVGVDFRGNQLFVLADPRTFPLVAQVLETMEAARRERREQAPTRDLSPERREAERERQETRYEYEQRQRGPERVEREVEVPYREFLRSYGRLAERGEELVVVETDDGRRLELVVPQVRDESGRWRVPAHLARQLDQAREGDRVVVEWWTADETRYLEAIETVREEESSIFR
ncbi:MAG: hypothetical protein KatS3mg115_0571 [Candidatus Poribacteria bacterium]|nr:MAG: hypothetical protein KatS3mg115_0571 [Candidatus Poribacteria bacterium]